MRSTGEKIRNKRKILGLTQEDLAVMIGIKRATLSRYETGVIDPPSSQVTKINDCFKLVEWAKRQSPERMDIVKDALEFHERTMSQLREGRSITIADGHENELSKILVDAGLWQDQEEFDKTQQEEYEAIHYSNRYPGIKNVTDFTPTDDYLARVVLDELGYEFVNETKENDECNYPYLVEKATGRRISYSEGMFHILVMNERGAGLRSAVDTIKKILQARMDEGNKPTE